jgi:hypothetical protein
MAVHVTLTFCHLSMQVNGSGNLLVNVVQVLTDSRTKLLCPKRRLQFSFLLFYYLVLQEEGFVKVSIILRSRKYQMAYDG